MGDRSTSDSDQGDHVDVGEFNGPVNSDVSYFRESGALVRYYVRGDATCPRCGFGEVYQPMQALNMPMCLRCLGCGLMEPSCEFCTTDSAREDDAE